jgi:hypothetical protein
MFGVYFTYFDILISVIIYIIYIYILYILSLYVDLFLLQIEAWDFVWGVFLQVFC